MTTLFITGIDTDIGKSVACGALAHSLLRSGHRLFTQKWVETGTDRASQDLLTHRNIAQQNFNTSNIELHSPYCFKYPASPHLSAAMEESIIDCGYLIKQTRQLETECDHLIIEGAGGLCVPLNQNNLMVDLVAQLKLPILLVTSARLGSINHTILSLEICEQRGIEVRAIIYNHFPNQENAIFSNTRDYLQNYLASKIPRALWLELAINSSEINLTEQEIEQLLD
ncbi:UNVERIFIED_CONTAM: hypothetical protein GTU68_051231 [Idotea baltica]|nr:hypothetical protein [Idotea baltica]